VSQHAACQKGIDHHGNADGPVGGKAGGIHTKDGFANQSVIGRVCLYN